MGSCPSIPPTKRINKKKSRIPPADLTRNKLPNHLTGDTNDILDSNDGPQTFQSIIIKEEPMETEIPDDHVTDCEPYDAGSLKDVASPCNHHNSIDEPTSDCLPNSRAYEKGEFASLRSHSGGNLQDLTCHERLATSDESNDIEACRGYSSPCDDPPVAAGETRSGRCLMAVTHSEESNRSLTAGSNMMNVITEPLNCDNTVKQGKAQIGLRQASSPKSDKLLCPELVQQTGEDAEKIEMCPTEVDVPETAPSCLDVESLLRRRRDERRLARERRLRKRYAIKKQEILQARSSILRENDAKLKTGRSMAGGDDACEVERQIGSGSDKGIVESVVKQQSDPTTGTQTNVTKESAEDVVSDKTPGTADIQEAAEGRVLNGEESKADGLPQTAVVPERLRTVEDEDVLEAAGKESSRENMSVDVSSIESLCPVPTGSMPPDPLQTALGGDSSSKFVDSARSVAVGKSPEESSFEQPGKSAAPQCNSGNTENGVSMNVPEERPVVEEPSLQKSVVATSKDDDLQPESARNPRIPVSTEIRIAPDVTRCTIVSIHKKAKVTVSINKEEIHLIQSALSGGNSDLIQCPTKNAETSCDGRFDEVDLLAGDISEACGTSCTPEVASLDMEVDDEGNHHADVTSIVEAGEVEASEQMTVDPAYVQKEAQDPLADVQAAVLKTPLHVQQSLNGIGRPHTIQRDPLEDPVDPQALEAQDPLADVENTGSPVIYPITLQAVQTAKPAEDSRHSNEDLVEDSVGTVRNQLVSKGPIESAGSDSDLSIIDPYASDIDDPNLHPNLFMKVGVVSQRKTNENAMKEPIITSHFSLSPKEAAVILNKRCQERDPVPPIHDIVTNDRFDQHIAVNTNGHLKKLVNRFKLNSEKSATVVASPADWASEAAEVSVATEIPKARPPAPMLDHEYCLNPSKLKAPYNQKREAYNQRRRELRRLERELRKSLAPKKRIQRGSDNLVESQNATQDPRDSLDLTSDEDYYPWEDEQNRKRNRKTRRKLKRERLKAKKLMRNSEDIDPLEPVEQDPLDVSGRAWDVVHHGSVANESVSMYHMEDQDPLADVQPPVLPTSLYVQQTLNGMCRPDTIQQDPLACQDPLEAQDPLADVPSTVPPVVRRISVQAVQAPNAPRIPNQVGLTRIDVKDPVHQVLGKRTLCFKMINGKMQFQGVAGNEFGTAGLSKCQSGLRLVGLGGNRFFLTDAVPSVEDSVSVDYVPPASGRLAVGAQKPSVDSSRQPIYVRSVRFLTEASDVLIPTVSTANAAQNNLPNSLTPTFPETPPEELSRTPSPIDPPYDEKDLPIGDDSVDWRAIEYFPPKDVARLYRAVRKRLYFESKFKQQRISYKKEGRPPYSYVEIAAMAIENEPLKSARFSTVVEFAIKHFRYYSLPRVYKSRNWKGTFRGAIMESMYFRSDHVGWHVYYSFRSQYRLPTDRSVFEHTEEVPTEDSEGEDDPDPEPELPEAEPNPLVPICSYSDEEMEATRESLIQHVNDFLALGNDKAFGTKDVVVTHKDLESVHNPSGTVKPFEVATEGLNAAQPFEKTCAMCPETFSTSQEATDHALSHSESESVKKCLSCDFTSPDDIQLMWHVNATH